ncbi:hypothetical protein CYLTODRAFT_494403 [Cylindrobasidium torrendii FP15055 ss-10]|uniref:Uncharacterized protein n=1 Tax=Cylindrobasidium torrendii FP15055 ss-10 TaxID=1314674 RepID=A0A0D7AX73_9AGAR|nr:hypothetical protein CYLTODRAFT_494403 [Cylindrobasidium torrendii FP15055 ss-10]
MYSLRVAAVALFFLGCVNALLVQTTRDLAFAATHMLERVSPDARTRGRTVSRPDWCARLSGSVDLLNQHGYGFGDKSQAYCDRPNDTNLMDLCDLLEVLGLAGVSAVLDDTLAGLGMELSGDCQRAFSSDGGHAGILLGSNGGVLGHGGL